MIETYDRKTIEDYQSIEKAIHFLRENFQDQPDLKATAEHVGLSEYHFQRLFRRWAGISPKRFLQFLTLEYAKEQLSQAKSILDVTYNSGLSSPGRLHDLFVTYEAMTPGEFKNQGAGLQIYYGFHPSPFGEALIAVTDKGVCGLAFTQDGDGQQLLDELAARWPEATLAADAEQTGPYVQQIFGLVADESPASLHLVLRGTPFQLKVWQALLKIPAGTLVSYNDVAVAIGQPKAARAVGNAVRNNPIGFIIPCHRVIRKMGAIHDYHWGEARKRAIIGWEAAKREVGMLAASA